ncbi:MAG: 23S rRNA (guanosine(2251)-2'-O)-methyltransferase RlmB, partial [Selenomonadaceae bacterium]|nr:23S rRNA (guanosine(2251)-2'-O)-methyltransferase RlmB [Selenomonadaceae bacterium]
MELLKSGHSVNKILIAEGSRDGSIQKIFSLAKPAGVIVEFV